MNKNYHILAILLFVFLTACSQEKKPNVIFILADDLGVNALNCYGNNLVESPNIDQLSKEGISLTNGYSNDPTCAPSRGSIMSGQYVPGHKIYRVADRYIKQPQTLANMKYLPPANNRVQGAGVGMSLDKITIAETLKANGYATAGFGKWHLGHGALGMEYQGFDQAFEVVGHYNFKTSPKQNDVKDNEYSADYITTKGVEFIKSVAKTDQPFFLYMPYYLVHAPFEPKPEYLKHFKEKLKGNTSIGEKEITVLAMIKSLDDSVGELLKTVEDLGIEEETIIVFTSDNGHYKTENNIFTQPYAGVKGQTLEGGIRVPYIFKWKNRIPEKTLLKEPVIHVDIYPTLLGLTNSDAPENYELHGIDISPNLYDPTKKTERDALIWEYTNYSRYSEKHNTWASKWVNVIQMDGYKLTEDVETDTYILYDLNVDPYETTEISSQRPEVMDKLKKRLLQWKKDVNYEWPVKNPAYKVGK